MLCTFTTLSGGALIVRSDDIRLIEDVIDLVHLENETAVLVWMVGDQHRTRDIAGTARDNMRRIQQEELDLIAHVNEHQQQVQKRLAEGYPAVPVGRGKQAAK